jgi:ABC-type amino acid transport substrate-binding protein
MTFYRSALASLLLASSLLAAQAPNSSPSAATSSVAPASSSMVIKYHFTERGDFHHSYNIELIRRILEVTVPEFGAFQIQPYGQAPVARRQALLLTEGELMNVQWASPGIDIANAEVIEIPIDILRGLQGYRVCMINSQAGVDFSRVRDVDSLKAIRIGQGVGWTELAIYYANGIRPLEPPNLVGLYPMLGFKRIDCIPLGINEISSIIEREQKTFPFMAIEPDLLIYYDLPIYFYVSKKHPDIARRFESGLKKLIASGEFDRLFQKYHLNNIQHLKLQHRRIICLKSPLSNNKHQCEGPQSIPDFFKAPAK